MQGTTQQSFFKNRSLLFLLIIAAVQIYWIINSDGFYFIDDSCHFNFNRHYLESYDYSTGAWHRLGRVLLFALPSQLGLKGVQIFSALIFLATIFFSYKILLEKKIKFAAWILPAIAFQPVLFNISYTALAEVPAACLIVMSFYFFITEKKALTLITASLIFIFRTEYFYVAGIYFLIHAFRKEFKLLPLVLLGPVSWYLYTTIISGNPSLFFYDMTIHSRLPKINEGIEWKYYFWHASMVYGYVQVIFFFAGFVVVMLQRKFKEHSLIISFILIGLVIQTLFALKGLNLTCSVGQFRYIAVVGPLVGIISVVGMNYLFEKIHNVFFNIIATHLLLSFMFFLGPFATPFHNKFKVEERSEEIVQFTKTNYPGYKIISNMHQLANAMDEPVAPCGEDYLILSKSNLQKTSKALIVWNKDIEGTPFMEDNVSLSYLESQPSFRLIKEYKDTVNNFTSIPLYSFNKEDGEHERRREFIEYYIKEQTTWEIIHIKVFVKE